VNYQEYLARVQERLQARGFAAVTPPPDLAAQFGLVLERAESWGRLMLALPAQPAAAAAEPREALARAAAAWVRNLRAHEELARYLILGFPFEREVPDETAQSIRALRQEDAEQRWGVVPWTLDLAVELIDRPSGFPKLEDAVSRALTEVPRGAVEGMVRQVSEPRVGARPRVGLKLDLGSLPVSRFILASTIAFYLWTVLMSGSFENVIAGPDNMTLVTWGANWGHAVVAGGQNWRLLTYLWLHGGAIHIFFNMYAFWSLGRYSELIYGPTRMGFIYVFAGVVGGAASTIFRGGNNLSVGASGAIFGLLGALVYFAWRSPGRINWQSLLAPIGINLLIGFMIPNIDNYAHVGGLIGGFVAAFIAGIPGERAVWRTALLVITCVGLVVLLSGIVPLPTL
jgi:membrane associated rhomboid family serine protease